MPIYEYTCKDCHHEFEALVSASRKPVCPECGEAKLEKKFSAFAVQGTSARTPVAAGPCGTCGDPRGAGACAYN